MMEFARKQGQSKEENDKEGTGRCQTGIGVTDALLHRGYKATAGSVGRETTNQPERKTKSRREWELKKCRER